MRIRGTFSSFTDVCLCPNTARCALWPLIFSFIFLASLVEAQVPPKKNILIVNEVGESHPAVTLITQELISGLSNNPDFQFEFYLERLDTTSKESAASQRKIRGLIVRKYQSERPDIIVAEGPTPVAFLASISPSIFPNIPVVICGAIGARINHPKLDSRFTGTWLEPGPAQTVDAAVHLFPETRHIAIVAGTSGFDRAMLELTLTGLKGYESKFDFVYLTDLRMGDLLEKLRSLPPHTIVLYISFFRDAAGKLFVNANTALRLVANASDSPVFGMADAYLGHGIVGGNLISFAAQGQIAVRIISAILEGTKPEQIPMYTAPNFYLFDWRELRRWRIREGELPTGSIVYFRQMTFWQRTWWIWSTSLLLIVGLSLLVLHLRRSSKQLQFAKDGQRELSGLLINAQERERSRLASELHDDFSQRLALLALELEIATENVSFSPEQVKRQLHDLLNSASELGADLHTLSHRLHSSTLESLGLVPAISASCKEFAAQQNIKIDLACDNIPRSLNPDVALCVFRIVQEALRNLKKYSGAGQALVRLQFDGDRVHVLVQDQGCGFDLQDLRRKVGLGVRSMEERARLVGGEFRIRSAIGRGTTVEASVPVNSRPGTGRKHNDWDGDDISRREGTVM